MPDDERSSLRKRSHFSYPRQPSSSVSVNTPLSNAPPRNDKTSNTGRGGRAFSTRDGWSASARAMPSSTPINSTFGKSALAYVAPKTSDAAASADPAHHQLGVKLRPRIARHRARSNISVATTAPIAGPHMNRKRNGPSARPTPLRNSPNPQATAKTAQLNPNDRLK